MTCARFDIFGITHLARRDRDWGRALCDALDGVAWSAQPRSVPGIQVAYECHGSKRRLQPNKIYARVPGITTHTTSELALVGARERVPAHSARVEHARSQHTTRDQHARDHHARGHNGSARTHTSRRVPTKPATPTASAAAHLLRGLGGPILSEAPCESATASRGGWAERSPVAKRRVERPAAARARKEDAVSHLSCPCSRSKPTKTKAMGGTERGGNTLAGSPGRKRERQPATTQ
eukprot:3207316-Rhodomonas_salina.1